MFDVTIYLNEWRDIMEFSNGFYMIIGFILCLVLMFVIMPPIPCLEVGTMFLSEHQNQNIQISAYLSHFFYAKNYFNFFVFMI